MSTSTKNPNSIWIPKTKHAWWSFVVNASKEQYLTITDASSNSIVTKQGSGNGAPTFVDQGTFQSTNPPYTVSIKSKNNEEEVLHGETTILNQDKVMLQTHVMISEDSTDKDFNDSFVTVTWFQNP